MSSDDDSLSHEVKPAQPSLIYPASTRSSEYSARRDGGASATSVEVVDAPPNTQTPVTMEKGRRQGSEVGATASRAALASIAELPRRVFAARKIGQPLPPENLEAAQARVAVASDKVRHVEVTGTPDCIEYISVHGGAIYVATRAQRCCSGMTLVDATTVAPPSVDHYRSTTAGGIAVFFRFPRGIEPSVLHLSLEGKRRKRPVASWDGCAFVN